MTSGITVIISPINGIALVAGASIAILESSGDGAGQKLIIKSPDGTQTKIVSTNADEIESDSN